MMDKLVRRVVTEKYVLGSYGENLPLVTLWDGIQQGVNISVIISLNIYVNNFDFLIAPMLWGKWAS